MFTGIIEEIGVISSVQKGAKSSSLAILGDQIFDDLKIGDSVAVNGVCLTVTSLLKGIFTADVMNETLSRSNLGDLKNGSKVNLERAMQAGDRFGGHIVSGHIDGTGQIINKTRDDNAVWLTISAPSRIMRYIIEKGSITIDGISLTVARTDERSFAVSIIPHTGKATTLLSKNVGQTVNLENDIVGKYIERFVCPQNESVEQTRGITMEFLANAGF